MFVVVDDFNYPDVDWDRPWLTKHEGFDNVFQAAVDELYLTQLVSQPTQRNNVLDVALISRPEIYVGNMLSFIYVYVNHIS